MRFGGVGLQPVLNRKVLFMSRHRLMIAGSFAFAAVSLLLAAGPREATWKQIDEAIAAGKPQTAIEILEPIIGQAMNENRYAEAIKAIAMKASMEAAVQGDRPEERIRRLESEIEKAPQEMKPAMEVILANWYWHYFQENRWRFAQRTQTSAPPEADFTTWDLPRILDEIDRHFVAALSSAESLKKIPVAEFDDLLEKGNTPDSYRPSLFDVVAHNALEFYVSGEQAASQAFDAFNLSADSPIFGPAADFISWQPDTTDDASLTLKAIRLYQQILSFHRDDSDQSAFLDTDLARLVFGHNQASGEEKNARLQAALRRFADQHATHATSSRALHELARSLFEANSRAEAHKVASEGLQQHPDSVGGRRCYNLIQEIEAKSIGVTTERVWNEPRPSINVTYRNINQVHFRLVRFDFDAIIRSGRWSAEQMDPESRSRLLAQQPVQSWSETLAETTDFQERVKSFPSPDDLVPGSYFLIASHHPSFRDTDNAVVFTEVWRSDLAMVMRNHQGENRIDGFVLDAGSGEPIVGATVRAWGSGRRGELVELKSQVTDKYGRFRQPGGQLRQALFMATHDGHSLSTANPLYTYGQEGQESSQQTLLFTDRSIYRPGQSIHFKGICTSLVPQRDDYMVLSRQDVVVALMDANGTEIERLSLRSNDYGSFSGTVTAPRDRLTGAMSLSVVQGPQGWAGFSVEEYKRPKFQVEIDPPAEEAKLLTEVRVKGQATAYTGASIGGAKVQWRVVREVRYPPWWFWRCWWLPPYGGESQEIAHGSTLTDGAGSFTIAFDAKPDPTAPAESEPVFHFSIFADVTDSTGETRSTSRFVQLGYASLSASLAVDPWLSSQQAVEIRVRTQSVDGEPRGAAGYVEVYSLVQPDAVTRTRLENAPWPLRSTDPTATDPSNPNSWPLGEVVHRAEFETGASGAAVVSAQLSVGMYRAKLVSSDAFGKSVTSELPITVIDPEATRLAIKVPELFTVRKESLEPGEEYLAIWGSGYDTARAFVEVIHRGNVIQQYWTEPDVTQTAIRQQVSEAMRGGFNVRTTMVRENRAYTQSRFVDVPWTNKQLSLRWEHFVSKLEPASKEVWTAIVSGPDAEAAVAEMVATLYDASLDVFRPHSFSTLMSSFRRDNLQTQIVFQNQLKHLQHLIRSWPVNRQDDSLTYRRILSSLIRSPFLRANASRRFRGVEMSMMGMDGFAADAPGESALNMEMRMSAVPESAFSLGGDGAPLADKGQGDQLRPDLSNVKARTNLNETAFFFPHLTSAEDGTIQLRFTMPEALTEWKFLGVAHDRQLRSGLLTGTTVTAKELMVEPNPPRFLREGDSVEFTVKVSNQSPTRQSGVARLTLKDARSGTVVDQQIGNEDPEREFDIAAGESQTLAWRLSVSDGLGFLIYTAVGSTGRLSDGEEGMLPVLSRRVLVTESLPLPIRGKQTKDFRFEKLINSGDSDSLRHQSVTLQMVSNPSWYAVMALPYLMEFPHECSEQTFNRLYANSIARHIAQSDPKNERIFAQWRATPALDSPLEKNDDIKGVLLEETPWVRQAERESQSRRNVGILFDNNRLDEESQRALQKLSEMQLADGAWPWFPGGRANDYITLYITTGFARMRHLGVKLDVAPAVKSLTRLDQWMSKQFAEIPKPDRGKNHLSATVALYLYGRSFFLKEQPIQPEHMDAWNYWRSQATEYWLKLGNRQSQAHVAIALKRAGQEVEAKQITDSLKERSVNDEEMGMFWRDLELSWWWYHAPIETQAMMIEAFDEVADDQQAVEDCKVWLLKQKQTQDWTTTKATADAVYALLLRGSSQLASDAIVSVSAGGQPVPVESVEAGTGFFEHRWSGSDVQPALGEIQLQKSDEGVAWGSLHWQYLEDMAKITPHEQTPLTLTKQLFLKKHSNTGPTLEPVNGPVEVGDELVVRLVLRTDRDMEYVHLKDYRGSGTEPVNVLSQYRYRDGLGYYESTRDTASHFFIDYLPKGTYVFEYSTRVQLRGNYQTGFANIQCMYAPEFNSHSESLEITAK